MKKYMIRINTFICLVCFMIAACFQTAAFAAAADKTALIALIQKADALNKAVYSEETWETLVLARSQAKIVNKDTTADQNSVDTALQNLQQGINSLQYAVTVGILSNNSLTAADKTNYYPESQFPKIAAGVAYSWVTAETNSDIIKYDEKNNKQELIGGNIDNTASDYTTNSIWSTSGVRTATAIFQLQKEYSVNRVDVWTKYVTSSFQAMDKFTVEVSTDGTNYTQVQTANNTNNVAANNNKMVRTIASFDFVQAKYIKVKMNNAANSYMLTVAEVLIFGCEPPVVPAVDFAISNIHYTDAAGTELLHLDGAAQIKINPTVTNNTGEDTDMAVIAVLYNAEGGAEAMNFSSDRVPAGGSKDFMLLLDNLPSGMNSNYTIRTFAFRSLIDTQPLTGVRRFGIDE